MKKINQKEFSRITQILIKKGFTHQNTLSDGCLIYRKDNKKSGWQAEIDPVNLTVNGITIEEFLDIYNGRKK
jgi:hypothetical protein